MGHQQNIPQLRYDTDRIKQDISFKKVLADMMGIHLNGKKSIRCIDPKHEDKNPSCVCTQKGCHCYSCNGSWDAIGVVQLAHPELNFQDACKLLLDTYGLNPYSYSNLAEVEAAKQAKAENRFIDCFPLTESEMKAIGLHNEGHIEIAYSVYAEDYFMHFYGEIPPREKVFDEDGNRILMEISRAEAVDMGVVAPKHDQYNDTKHEYINIPRIQDLWKEDKSDTEEMIYDKAKEKLDEVLEKMTNYSLQINEYKNTHSVECIQQIDKLRSGYINARINGANVRLTSSQEDKINGLYHFEKLKDLRNDAEQEYNKIEKICEKIINHREERKKAQQKGWEKQ